MKRPLTAALLYFISGALAGQYIQDNISIVLFFVIGLLSCLALYIIYKWDMAFTFALVLLAGILSVRLHGMHKDSEIETGARGEAIVSVNALVVKPAGGTGFIAETRPDKVKILVYASGHESPKAGDIIKLTGEPRYLSPARNPGGFDEKMYYAARGVKYKMYPVNIDTVSHDSGLNAYVHGLRDKLSNVYDMCLPEKEAGIMKSIIIGDRSQLMNEVKDLYSAAGIYHILAISGLHISVIGLFLDILLRKVLSRRASGILTLFLLIFYCLMTGASPSTVRAVTICGVIIFGRVIFREGDPLTSLSFAALCILIYNPFYLWDLGFQLSFSAMAGIILLSEPLNILFKLISSKIPPAKKFFENFWVEKSLTLSVAVFIATLPVGTSYLPYISTYSCLINLIIFPTFFLLVGAGLLAGCAGLFWTTAGTFLAGILYYMLNFYEAILNFFVNLPYSSLLTGYIPLYLTVPYYLFVGLSAHYLLNLPHKAKKIKKYCLASLIVLAAVIIVHKFAPRPLEVTMLDVSQGDSFVIKKDNFTAVIDGGGWPNVETGQNTGAKILVPYLNYLGVSKVDLAVATHLDHDHASGIIELMSAKKVKILCLPEYAAENALYEEAVKTASDNGVELKLLKKGDVYTNRDITITCLYPDENADIFETNESSIVLKLEYMNNSFLFTGDITERVEKSLIGNVNLSAQVLKLAHHGSKYSNSKEFLDAVSPGLAIVSYSKYNNYGLLPREVKARLKDGNIPLLETAENGAVTLISDGSRLRIKRSIR